MKPRATASESGVVLIAVLGAILLLTMMALALSSAVRMGTEELQDRKEYLQAYYLARGALFTSSWLLTQVSDRNLVLHPGQQTIVWTLTNGKVQVDLCDERGKLDLNLVNESLLEKLIVALGYDLKDSRLVATAIVDWRDPSSLARWEHARASGNILEYSPTAAQARYHSVEEILNVPGITPAIAYGHYSRADDGTIFRVPGLLDCLTVDSNSPQVNINYAPYPVLLALTDMNSSASGFIVQRRAQKPFTSVSDLTSQFPASLSSEARSLLSTLPGNIFTLTASGQSRSGITARVRAVVKIQFQASRTEPFQILRWKDAHVQ